jgi:competence protein ComEC
MNMAIISVMVLFILKALRFPRVVQFILTGIFLLAYAVLSGWSASVVRSVLMAIVILSSFCVEHETDTINSLGLAAIILFLLNPLNLFDIGFQLSFISVAMIVRLYPLTQSWTEEYIKPKFFKYLAQAFCISLVAWVGISPLIAYEFNMVSPISIIANIPVVPLADLIIILSLGLVVVGLFCPLLAVAFAGTLKAVFNLTLILIAWFAQVPGGYFYIHNFTFFGMAVCYLAIIIVYFIIQAKRGRKPLKSTL